MHRCRPELCENYLDRLKSVTPWLLKINLSATKFNKPLLKKNRTESILTSCICKTGK